MNSTQIRKATAFTPSLSRADTKHRQRNANKQVRQAGNLEIGLFTKPERECPRCRHNHSTYDTYDTGEATWEYEQCGDCGEIVQEYMI